MAVDLDCASAHRGCHLQHLPGTKQTVCSAVQAGVIITSLQTGLVFHGLVPGVLHMERNCFALTVIMCFACMFCDCTCMCPIA